MIDDRGNQRRKSDAELDRESTQSVPGDASLQTPALLGLECPPELSPLGREEWIRIVGELTALGRLSRLDRGPLAIYCAAYAMWAEALDAIQKFGLMIKSPNGHPMQSPYLAVFNRQADVMLRVASEFGFTPASRSRNFSCSQSQSMLLDMKPGPDGGFDHLGLSLLEDLDGK